MKSYSTKLALAITLTLGSTHLIALEDQNITQVDALILYSQGVKNLYDGDAQTKINHLITTTNKIYKDSGLNLVLNAVKVKEYPMDDNADSITALLAIQGDVNVTQLRDQVGADEVIVYRPYANDGYCGIAYQNDYLRDPEATWIEKYGYAHITIDCGAYATAHEVGHNMGLGHSVRQDSEGAYPYARGHGEDGLFTTIMAYEQSYNGKKIYKFSSPNLECEGLPCGIEEGAGDEADAVKALKKTTPLVANFRAHIIEDNTTTIKTRAVDENDTPLEEAKKAYEEQKQKVTDSKQMLTQLKDIYKDKKTEYISLRSAYQKVVSDYKQARKEYRNKLISKETFLAQKAKVTHARQTLVEYKTQTLQPARKEVRDYFNNTYKAEVAKLKVLKEQYIKLQNENNA